MGGGGDLLGSTDLSYPEVLTASTAFSYPHAQQSIGMLLLFFPLPNLNPKWLHITYLQTSKLDLETLNTRTPLPLPPVSFVIHTSLIHPGTH